MVNRLLTMLLCCWFFASCNVKPNPESVAQSAIREAESEITESAFHNDEPDGPFLLDYKYCMLIEQQNVAIKKSSESINKDMKIDNKENFDNEKEHNKYVKQQQIADSLRNIATEYIRNHYRQPIEDAINEIDGLEFLCNYDSDYVQTANAFVERDPNDLQNQGIRLRVEMVLNQPSLNHTVFFVKNGVPATPGYGDTMAQRFFRIDEGSKYKYESGTRVRFFVSLNSSEVFTIQSLYIKEFRYN